MKIFPAIDLRDGDVVRRLLCPWNFPGKNTGVGCHFLLQGMDLPDLGIGTASPIWQVDSLPLTFL